MRRKIILATSSQFLTSFQQTSTNLHPFPTPLFTAKRLVHIWQIGCLGFGESLPNEMKHQTCQPHIQRRAAMSKAHQASSRAFFRERFSRIMGRNFTFGVIWAVLSDLLVKLYGDVEKKNIDDLSSVSLAR